MDPLIIPELLTAVLGFMDKETLKSCRLVNQFWNTQAGPFLATSKIRMISRKSTDISSNNKRMRNLQLTLARSSDPSKFFGSLLVAVGPHKGIILKQILHSYGKFLHTFAYRVQTNNSSNEMLEGGSPFLQQFILKLLSRWCPQLQEFRFELTASHTLETKLNNRSLSFDPNCTLKLKTIKLIITCEVDEHFQDFLVELIERSTELKSLIITTTRFGNNWVTMLKNRLYQKISKTNSMKQLNEFGWLGNNGDDVSNLFSNFQFCGEIKSLRLHRVTMKPNNFQQLLDSVGQNLKMLDLRKCKFPDGNGKNFELDIFKAVVQKLRNLESLDIEFLRIPEDFSSGFSDAEKITVQPHKKLKKLTCPWNWPENIWEVNSLISLMKWFPSLTFVSLTLGFNFPFQTMQKPLINFEEAVRVLSGLKKLKRLYLKGYNSRIGDVQKTFKALKDIPSLQNFALTLVSLSVEYDKDSEKFGDVENFLSETGNLNVIQLNGFKFDDEDSMMDWAKNKGISLYLGN